MRFPYTLIRSWTLPYDPKLNTYIFLTHSSTNQFLPSLINHNQTNPFRTIVKICNHFLYTQNYYKKIFTFFFILYKKEKILRRASLKTAKQSLKNKVSQTTKERKAKFNKLSNDLNFRENLSTKNKPPNYSISFSSWIDIGRSVTDSENEYKLLGTK